MFSRLIVGTDGSRRAQLGVDVAKKLAQDSQVRIEIVHVREQLVGGGAAGLPVLINEDEILRDLRAQVRGLAAQGYDVGLQIRAARSRGAAQAIADAATELDADVIVIASRGLGAFTGLVLGSVTKRLLQIAPCPVLVVPAHASPADLGSDR